MYNKLQKGVHFGYFLLVALGALIVYRLVLKNNLLDFSVTAPFCLVPETHFETFFKHGEKIYLTNVNTLNYKYKLTQVYILYTFVYF